REYTSEPRVIISGGGGTGAAAEAVIEYGIQSIQIVATGKCNYTGAGGYDIELIGGGATEEADVEVIFEPETLHETTFVWRYRKVYPTNTA
ncbi:hypothetical protein, partial [Escherichia coli]|uniref:hypothetical protein n=1 Tax=Escherichia coli TaxID=562 RepID=UPI00196286F2